MYDHLKELAETFVAEWPNFDEEAGRLEQESQNPEAGDLLVKAKVLDFLFLAYQHGVRDSIRVLEVRAGLPRSVAMNNEVSKCITALGAKLLRDGGTL